MGYPRMVQSAMLKPSKREISIMTFEIKAAVLFQ